MDVWLSIHCIKMENSVLKMKNCPKNGLIITIMICLSINVSSAQNSNGSIDFIFNPSNGITQFAVWLENPDGEYIRTVYVTDFIGRRGGGNRTSDPDIDSGEGNRLNALPVWAFKRGIVDTTFGIENVYPPAWFQPSYPEDMDAVSGATVSQGLQMKILLLSDLPFGVYVCCIEVNKSFDKNEYHDYSYYRGQPSVIWKTNLFISDSDDSSRVLDYCGYGSPDGSDGNINPPDSTITSAVDLIQTMADYKFKTVYSAIKTNIPLPGENIVFPRFPALYQNYPNPFNASTTFNYFLPRRSQTNLSIYNSLGQKVITLINDSQPSGYHRVVWHGRDQNGLTVGSGVYFYKLKISDISQIKKMVILK